MILKGSRTLGLGFASKRVAPKAPLWALQVATEVLDLLFPLFKVAGMEYVAVSIADIVRGIQIVNPGWTPWSHGLFMSLIWSVLTAAIAYLFLRNRKTSYVIGLLVFSHWVLDYIVHITDLPLFFADSPLLGLGLWGSGPGLINSGILE
jgi:hypothetical protein